MVAFITGVVLAVLGILGLIFWFGVFVVVLKGSLPFIFTVCGLAAIAVGISSMKDKMAAEAKEEPQPEPKPEEETKSEDTSA